MGGQPLWWTQDCSGLQLERCIAAAPPRCMPDPIPALHLTCMHACAPAVRVYDARMMSRGRPMPWVLSFVPHQVRAALVRAGESG